MTWLRYFNPFYCRRLEQDQSRIENERAEIETVSLRLAASTSRLAQSTNLLAEKAAGNIRQIQEDEETIRLAKAAIQNMQATLATIAVYMTTGRISDAKVMIDALIMLIEGPKC